MKTIAILAIRIVTILGYVATVPATEVIKRTLREERKLDPAVLDENPAVLCDKCINDCVDNFDEFSCDVQCSTYDDDSPVKLACRSVCNLASDPEHFRAWCKEFIPC